ncbi:MAG: hypothetical protein JWN85_5192 [Gammaproteobacteria bacterium]|nr:hypothetical protein [Gammaproteobacteria bacterium]
MPFNRGVAEEPRYWPLYTGMLRVLMPRWLGSQEDISRFIQEVSGDPNNERDFAKYARLYWSYSSLEHDDVKLFEAPLAHWSTMRAGFMDLQRKYPNSDLILNAYAKFACMADDGTSYREVRPKLRDRLATTAWSDKVSLELCDARFPGAAFSTGGHTSTPPRLRLP